MPGHAASALNQTTLARSSAMAWPWKAALGASVVWILLSGLQLGSHSAFTYGMLPQHHPKGAYWGTAEGYTATVDGVLVNRESLQMSSLAEWFRTGSRNLPVPLGDLIYVRFAGYSLLMSAFAPWLGLYGAGVAINMVLWMLAIWCGMDLVWRWFHSTTAAALMGAWMATAPIAGVTVGQLLPYLPSFALWMIGIWAIDRWGVCERDVSWRAAVGFGLFSAFALWIYDVYHLVALVWLLGFRKAPWPKLMVITAVALIPRMGWLWWWSHGLNLPMKTINQHQPLQCIQAWLEAWRAGVFHGARRVVHRVLMSIVSVGDAMAWIPVLLAWIGWRQSAVAPYRRWMLAILAVGELPALVLASMWPHLPRWHFFVFPAVLILASMGAAAMVQSWSRKGSASVVLSWSAVVLIALIMNAHVLGLPQLALRIVH